jgi:hypothetical protein
VERERLRRLEPKKGPVDGWEDEFGPCPPPESDWTWFDEVAVDNAMFGGLVRPLTRLEQAEFIRGTMSWSLDEAAVCGHMTIDEVKRSRMYHAALASQG